MQHFLQALKARFGDSNVSTIHHDFGTFLLITSSDFSGTLLMTSDFSTFKMNVHEKHEGEEFAELYFYLPNYWVINDLDNPSMNWVFPWLKRIKEYRSTQVFSKESLAKRSKSISSLIWSLSSSSKPLYSTINFSKSFTMNESFISC
jgi:hypothetical protein